MTDEHQALGALGDQWLERYEQDPDVAHLSQAIAHYESAIAATPAHDEQLDWWQPLAMAYQERAARDGDLSDFDRAVTLHRRLADALVAGDERDTALAFLAETHWQRFLTAFHRLGLPEPDGIALARTTAAAIGDLAGDVGASAPATVVGVLHGLALAHVASLTGEAADLDAGIAVLAPALDRLDPELPYHEDACVELCCAYTQRSIRDSDPADLDLAIRAGTPAAASADPYAQHALACAYQLRWDAGDDPADLDPAIAHWQRALAVVAEPSGLAECARLLCERAEARSDPADADEAVTLLERAAEAGEPCRWYLGMALHLRWQLAGQRADLDRAAECLDRGLAEPRAPEWLVTAHRERLAVTRERVEGEIADDPTRPASTSTALVRHVDEAREVLASGVGEHDDRVQLAAAIAINSVLTWQSHPDRMDPTWLRETLAFCRTLRDAPPQWNEELDSLDALARYTEQAMSGNTLSDDALEALLERLRTGQPDPRARAALLGMAPVFMAGRAIRNGDRRMLRLALAQLRDSADSDDHLLAETIELADRAAHLDLTALDDLRPLLTRLRTTPSSYTAQQSILPLLTIIESVVAGIDGHYQPVDRTPIAAGDVFSGQRVMPGLAGPVMAAITRHDVATLREAAARVDELLAVAHPGDVHRLIVLGIGTLAGSALLRDEPGDQDAARLLLRWTGEGLDIAGGPHHPRWSAFALARAEALRQLPGGDLAESRRLGLASMWGFAWQVLLQSGTDDAVLVAADAGATAHRVAGWCRVDGAPDDAIAALDAGRGLVLYAATASRTIADRLVEAGHADLAERWRASAGYGSDVVTGDPLRPSGSATFEVPDDLRTRVLHVLDLSAPAPASAADLRAALAATGMDALVYLVPAGVDQPGAAVVVPADGEVTMPVLPGLITGPGSVFASSTARTRDAGPVTGTAEPVDAGPDDLCRWAWSAAMGPLLKQAKEWGHDRPARLVLVPTGALSAVPWHAAFRTDGSARHYAVEEATISYAVSGRSFVETAAASGQDVKSVLIVGDPTGDLPFAGVEARAIGRVFYPEATFLGLAAGSGTPQQVLDWIGAAAPGPSLLHLACHGHADPAHPADACLRLAGGALTARRLLDASRTAELEIERVFLAACTTGAGGADHDEAFSLAAAFHAAGAKTVFGALWKVPDEETSLLMFLVHHFLNEHGCAPVDALRAAQLWMLDPHRQPPAGMPADLAGQCGNPRAADPISWAAFTHRGR